MALCDVPCYFPIRAKWHIRGTPSPFLRHQLALKLVTLWRLFPHITLTLIPVPCPGPYGLLRGLAGGYQPLPYWAKMGPGNSHYYYW